MRESHDRSRPVRYGLPLLVALALLVCTSASVGAQPAVVAATGRIENVRVEPRGGGTVAIVYDLLSDDPAATFTVELEASRDEGVTFDLTPRSVSGDVGPSVTPGDDKTIVWQASRDVEALQLDRFRFNVRAVPVTRTAAATGQLTITSVPVAARVLVDGTERGVTPLTLTLPTGRRDIRLERDGYLENRRAVDVRSGGAETLAVTLTALGGPSPTKTAAPPKSGGPNPLVWVGLAAGGAAAAALALGGGGGDDGRGGGTTGGNGGGGTITPPPTCTFAASPANASFPAGGGSAPVTVAASPAGCTGGSWTSSSSQAPWVTISPASGAAAGTVTLTAGANVTPANLAGSVTVAGTAVTVTQPSSCAYSAIFVGGDGDPRDSPRTVVPGDCVGPNCGRRRIQMTSAAQCAWTVSGLPSWLTIEEGLGPFTGSRQIIMYVTQTNPGGSFRQTTFTVGTQTMTVEQCPGRCP